MERGTQRVTVLDVAYSQKRYLRRTQCSAQGAYSTLFNNLYGKRKIEKKKTHPDTLCVYVITELGACTLMEKAMAPHFSTLAWKIPWTEEPGRLQSMGSLRVGHN